MGVGRAEPVAGAGADGTIAAVAAAGGLPSDGCGTPSTGETGLSVVGALPLRATPAATTVVRFSPPVPVPPEPGPRAESPAEHRGCSGLRLDGGGDGAAVVVSAVASRAGAGGLESSSENGVVAAPEPGPPVPPDLALGLGTAAAAAEAALGGSEAGGGAPSSANGAFGSPLAAGATRAIVGGVGVAAAVAVALAVAAPWGAEADGGLESRANAPRARALGGPSPLILAPSGLLKEGRVTTKRAFSCIKYCKNTQFWVLGWVRSPHQTTIIRLRNSPQS